MVCLFYKYLFHIGNINFPLYSQKRTLPYKSSNVWWWKLLPATGGITVSRLFLLGDFNHTDVSWRSSTASCQQTRRLLKCIMDKLLIQVVAQSEGMQCWNHCSSASRLISDIRFGGCLGWSNHAVVEFRLLGDTGWTESKMKMQNFRKVKFHLFRVLVNKTICESVLEDKEAEQSWQIFKKAFLPLPHHKASIR